ncbi:MAG: extracellular solute-binding protein [Ignavibacteriales bacterium]|nr:extracellular solute-binding protein [Ignavibacteriales bacterium]
MKKYLLQIFHYSILIIVLFFNSCTMKNEPNRIVIWHQMRVDERVILEEQMKKYMQSHPGVKIEAIYKETEELRSGFIIAAIAGQGPDLIHGPSDQVGPFQVMDIIKPMDDIFSKSYLDSFNPKALTYYKGNLYQIADKLGNHLTLVYNKKLLTNPPQTDQEMIEIGRKLTVDKDDDGKTDQYGLVWNYTEPFFFIPFMTGFGGWIMDEDGMPTLDNRGVIGGLIFIKELRDKYKIIPKEADYNIADALFKDGKAAMIINGDWSWAGYKKAGIDIGIAPLPRIVKTGLWCAPMVSPKGFSINKNVPKEKIDLILDILKYLLNSENQLQTAKLLNTMPALSALYEDPFIKNNEILKNSQIQIDRGRPMPVVPELRAIWDAMRPSYQAVLGGVKTPEQAAKDMQSLALRKIAEMNE